MAFSSSVPVYNLDHHHQHHNNWHHQLQQQQSTPNNYYHHHQLVHENPQLQAPQVEAGLIRGGSTVDRARLAKLPLPEAGLNCPRCDSTQTKFCYFNNYSLTQPRHFCKTCRRYWTRGGALRSVPVGGGCRRNKRTKTTRSTKSSLNITSTTNTNPPKEANNNNISTESPSSSNDQIVANHFNPFSSQPPLNMAALHNLNNHYGAASAYGGFKMGTGNSSQSDTRFQLGHLHTPSTVNNSILTNGGAQGWRLPILTAYEQQPTGSNIFSYQGEGSEVASAGAVKVEETRGGLNLSRQLLDVSNQNNSNNNNEMSNQYWSGSSTGGGNSWTTAFTSHVNNATNSTTPFLL